MTGTDGISSLGKLLGSLQTNDAAATKASTVITKLDSSTGVQKQDQTSVSVAGGLAAQAAGDSDVRLDKVSQLRAAIAGGTYNVSSSAVADKLVESLLSGR